MGARTDLRNAIEQAVVDVAKSPDNALQRTDAAEVAAAVNEAAAPVVLHATNNEPWYTSRVTLGSLLAVVAGILGIFGVAFPAELQGQVISAVLAVAPLIGGAFALYGRWKAKKPIGA